MLRSLGRRLYYRLPGAAGGVRVHHFIPGIGLCFATSGAAILIRDDDLDRWMSLPFGVGLALTNDELGLLVGASNPYWGGARLALAQRAAASLTSAALAAVFTRAASRTSTPSEPSRQSPADHCAGAGVRVVPQFEVCDGLIRPLRDAPKYGAAAAERGEPHAEARHPV